MKYVWGSLKALRTLLFVGFLMVSLALNVTMFVGGTLYTAASSFVETVTGFRPVASRHAAQLASLRNELEFERGERIKLQSRLNSVSSRVNHTADRVTKRTSRSVARDIASMPGEALPWAGMAVIAGVTVLEVNDLCATLEDMDELKRAVDPLAERDEEAFRVCSFEVPTREELWEAVKDSPSQAWQKAKESVAGLPDLAGDYLNSAVEQSGRIWTGTKNTAGGAWDWLWGEGGGVD